jgi:hypothetical protein
MLRKELLCLSNQAYPASFPLHVGRNRPRPTLCPRRRNRSAMPCLWPPNGVRNCPRGLHSTVRRSQNGSTRTKRLRGGLIIIRRPSRWPSPNALRGSNAVKSRRNTSATVRFCRGGLTATNRADPSSNWLGRLSIIHERSNRSPLQCRLPNLQP